jgi:aspartate-semialdehyde dehydrogenase
MKIAVVGATGLVGSTMLSVLEQRITVDFELIPVASESSIGRKVRFRNKEIGVVSMQHCISQKPDIALFSAGGTISLEYAPQFKNIGCTVIDNSSAWRMHHDVKLIVPEVNGNLLTRDDKIIANPNCSTIQLVLVLKVIHELYRLKRVVVSTYQSVSGSGYKGMEQLANERSGKASTVKAYPHTIDKNLIPRIDVVLDNAYTKEEMKIIEESRKILSLPELKITATAVRVPVEGGHSESVNIETELTPDLSLIRQKLAESEGLIVMDNPGEDVYPMPLMAKGRDEVFVGRIRKDESVSNGLNLWIVADNLRKGAATNAVQIAERLLMM